MYVGAADMAWYWGWWNNEVSTEEGENIFQWQITSQIAKIAVVCMSACTNFRGCHRHWGKMKMEQLKDF